MASALPTIVNKVDGCPPYGYGHSGAIERTSDVGEHILGAIHRNGHHLDNHMSHGFRNVTSDVGEVGRDVVKAVGDCCSSELEATRDVGTALAQDVCSLSKQVGQGFCDTTAKITEDIKDFALFNLDKQHLIQAAIHQEAGVIGVAIGRTQKQIAKEHCKTREAVAAGTFALAQGQKEILLDACKNTKEILLEGRDTREKLSDKLCAIEVQAAKNQGELLLDNCRNTEKLSSQLAECCCKIENLIVTDGNATRTLILEQETAALNAEIADLRLRARSPPSGSPLVGPPQPPPPWSPSELKRRDRRRSGEDLPHLSAPPVLPLAPPVEDGRPYKAPVARDCLFRARCVGRHRPATPLNFGE